MSAHVLLNLLNPLEKSIRCIHLYHKKYAKKKQQQKKQKKKKKKKTKQKKKKKKKKQQQKTKQTFIKQIAGQLIQDTNLISILMYHMLLHKAQT